MNKRHKIIITSSVLPLALIVIWYAPLSIFITYKFYLIGGVVTLSYLLSLWSLWEGISKLKGAVLLILPTLFTLALAGYYFLLPLRWPVPTAVIFGLTFYTLLLSQNVFNVASIRTIPLYRVASTTAFVLTLMTAFLLFNVMFSLNQLFLWNGAMAFLISFPLVLQLLWSIEMEGINGRILAYTGGISLITGELALALSFWPIFHPLASLILMTALFVTVGTSTHFFRERMTPGVVWEYVAWGVAVFIIAAYVTSWTGE